MENIIIIGGGPAGLALANKLEGRGIKYLLIEGRGKLGGQLTELYPHKLIVDIPSIPSIEAQSYIDSLESKINPDHIILNESISNILVKKDEFELLGINKSYKARILVIASGLGQYIPRKLELENEDSCDNILYFLKDYAFLKNKKVLIFGGGDSALDWAKGISLISNNVSLIHRRDEFRGNPDTIKDAKNLNIYLSYIPNKLIVKNNKVNKVEIKDLKTNLLKELSCDYVLVNFGSTPSPVKFDLPKEGLFIKVNTYQESLKNIYCIGDACSYDGKIRRIAPALKEVEIVFEQILRSLN